MKRFLKITGIVIGSTILIAAGAVGYFYYKLRHFKDTHDLQARVDKFCNKYIADGKSVGLCVGIIQGDTVYIKGYGYTDKTTRKVPDANTIFEIGSISKVFTAEMTQLLVEQGQLQWSDSISMHLPQGVKLPVADSTTLQHLATHTSGFPRLPESWFSAMTNECDPYSTLTTQHLLDYLQHATDKRKPGPDAYDYSNLGMGLLGHILEWKTDKPYDSLLQTLICRPLGLTHTTSNYVVDTANFATGYDEQAKPTCHWQFPIIPGAGALRSDMNDMIRFLQANIRNSTALEQSLHRTQEPVAEYPGGQMGLGWHIDKTEGALLGVWDIIWHNGGTGGFRSYMGYDPATKRGIVVWANQSSDDLDVLAIKLMVFAAKVSLK